jgi:hypothetical protein
MSVLGTTLTLLLGPTVAAPAPPTLVENLRKVEVTTSDETRSGFQLTFDAGRSGPADAIDYPLLTSPLLKPFNRVILLVVFGALPRVLMDGIITHLELAPGSQPGSSTLTVTGEDVTVMMDLEEKSAEHPGQDETIIANIIILQYAQYGLIPTVIPPLVVDPPIPIERIPVQQGTDLQYLKEMADRHGYVFYVTPGPAPFINTAYWGPPTRLGVPQRALSVDLGPDTNVDSVTFRNNALAPTLVSGTIQDRITNQDVPVESVLSTRLPLSSQPALLFQSNLRTVQLRTSGLNISQAFARAQGITDASTDVLTAEGQLDALRYGDLLQPRGLAGLRGAGYAHDGIYYVKRVKHSITRGEYKQQFTLTREGSGSITPAVIP